MGYLDNAGLVHLWGKVRAELSGKQSRLTGGTAGQVLMKASDEDGDFVWTTISGVAEIESISIAVPPDKVEYQVGETFDPTGMSVLAFFSNGTSAPIGSDRLTFSPAGPLEAGTTHITVSYTSGAGTVTTQQQITVSVRHTYGVYWDGTNTTKWSRTDDSALFADPVPYVSGADNYSSPFDTLQPWAGMVKSERSGGMMVAIPKFWYKLTQIGNGLKVQITDREADGFYTSPAHMDRGDGNGERDVVYIGRYHCGGDFKSSSGQMPKLSTKRSDFRTGIHALGPGIWQADFAMRVTLWLLYLVEFADWNSQAVIGKGCGDNESVQAVGYTDSMPYHTGTTQDSRDAYGLGTQYRNIEGLWDNCYDFADGCYSNSDGLNIILNPSDFSESGGGVSVGTPTNGWPSAFSVVDQAGFPMIIPSESKGGEAAASCDYWSFNPANPVTFVGGYYSQLSSRGLFYVNSTNATYAVGYLGSRIQELP